MTMILFILYSAFSFLNTDYGLLQQNMGFLSKNPASMKKNSVVIMGGTSALDAKDAAFKLSTHCAFFNIEYRSFGEVEVRGDVPYDDYYTSSYPYLFKFEMGGNTYLGRNTVLGASMTLFEQRIMMDNLQGYFINIGGEYLEKRFSVGGYIRNIGAKLGYNRIEKYALPKEGAIYGIYSADNNKFSIELSSENLKIENFVVYLSYIKRLNEYLLLGSELAMEKDLSFGYKVKYPLRLSLGFEKNNYSIGILFYIPKGSMDIKNSLYLGVML